MAPYVTASYLKRAGEDCQIYDFVNDELTFNGWTDIRIEDVGRCGNFENEHISKRIYYIGRHEKFYIQYLSVYKPTEVWISCLFTYNWKAAKFVADLTRQYDPNIKIKIGGVYATLCPDHARQNIDCDEVVVSAPDDPMRLTKVNINLYRTIPYMYPILTSTGCAFRCKWCAVHIIEGTKRIEADPMAVADQIEQLYYCGVKRIRFMDSDILHNFDKHLKVILDEIIKRKVKISLTSYGGVNPLFATQEALELMAQAGFKSIQIPLESVSQDILAENRHSIRIRDWEFCISQLHRIKNFSISSYVLCGLPGQKIQDIYKAINFVQDYGVSPQPLFFTPIPGTPYEDPEIPLEYANPYLFPYASPEMPVEELEQIVVNHIGVRGNIVYIPEYIKGNIITSGKPIPKEEVYARD